MSKISSAKRGSLDREAGSGGREGSRRQLPEWEVQGQQKGSFQGLRQGWNLQSLGHKLSIENDPVYHALSQIFIYTSMEHFRFSLSVIPVAPWLMEWQPEKMIKRLENETNDLIKLQDVHCRCYF